MQSLRKEEAHFAIEEPPIADSAEPTEAQASFNNFAGLLLGTALGLYSWMALLLLLHWIF